MNWKHKQKDTEVSDSIGLLISILVRYPEVGTINYDPKNQVLKFTFLFSTVVENNDITRFNHVLNSAIETYNFLENKQPEVTDIQFHNSDGFTMLEITRDVNTLTKEELSLIIEIVNENLRQALITEQNDYFMEEELIMQEELIDHMLENLKTTTLEKNLIAFREDGRVLVFNK